MLQAKIRTVLGDLVKRTNQEIERGWKEWGYPEYASADGHDSWTEIERLAIQTVVIDGECIIRRLRGFDNEFGYALQFIDADLLDEQYNVAAGPGQNQIKMGVEVDRWNRAVAYHIWSRYGDDMSGRERRRERVPADEITHLFVRYRINQTRGITWLAPVLTSVRHLDGYEISELVAARASAAKMGFIKNVHPDAVSSFVWKADQKPTTTEVEPGVIQELLPGQEFQEFDPTHPSTAYEMFTSTVLRAVARGLRISYLTLTGDLRQANYSSMRAGLQPERDRWRVLHTWFACHFHRVVYRDWIDLATLKGAVAVDTRLGSDYYEVEWKGRGWKWVDPKSDLEAAQIEVSMGLNSRQRLAAEQGRDFEEIIDEIAYEEEFAEDAGVDISGVTQAPAAPAPQNSTNDQDGNPNTTDTGDGSGDPANARTVGRQRALAAVG
jgi:lambda family phage portal protein